MMKMSKKICIYNLRYLALNKCHKPAGVWQLT